MGKSELVNIGPKGRSLRRKLAGLFLALAVLLALYFFVYDISRYWRLLLFVPIFLGIHYVYEVRTGTCTIAAELGLENLKDDRPGLNLGTKIADNEKAKRIRNVSRRAQLKAFLVAAAITLVVTVLPS